MSVRMLFNGKCVIRNYTKDRTKKTATSSWLEQSKPVPCRVLKRESTLLTPDKGTATTMIRVRIALPRTAVVHARDRLAPVGDGREYEVTDVTSVGGAKRAAYQLAICKALGAAKIDE